MRLRGPRARARGSVDRLRGGAGGGAADVDEALYSRQLYVMGHAAQRSLASAAVLLIGLSGLGAEVSKNVALAGVASLDVHDPTPARYADLSSSWLLREADVGKPRHAAAMSRLAALNEHVVVRVLGEDGRPLSSSTARADAGGDGDGTEAAAARTPATVPGSDQSGGGGAGGLGGGDSGGAPPVSSRGPSPSEWWSNPSSLHPYSAVVACDLPYPSLLRLAAAARSASTHLVACWSCGVFGGVFCDFGEAFEVADTDGEPPRTALLEHVAWADGLG